MPERIQRRWLYVPSNKSLRRRVQWRLPRACHLHCHRTCKLNDFCHQQGILRHFCLVPAEILPLSGSHSLPLTAPVFQNNLYIAPACFPHQFGILSAEGWGTVWNLSSGERGTTTDGVSCMCNFSVPCSALPNWISLFAIGICWIETECILVAKPRDSWENSVICWLAGPSFKSSAATLYKFLGPHGQSCWGKHVQWLDPALVLVLSVSLSIAYWWLVWYIFQKLSRKVLLLIHSSCQPLQFLDVTNYCLVYSS